MTLFRLIVLSLDKPESLRRELVLMADPIPSPLDELACKLRVILHSQLNSVLALTTLSSVGTQAGGLGAQIL